MSVSGEVYQTSLNPAEVENVYHPSGSNRKLSRKNEVTRVQGLKVNVHVGIDSNIFDGEIYIFGRFAFTKILELTDIDFLRKDFLGTLFILLEIRLIYWNLKN